jgi:hypothetical protein
MVVEHIIAAAEGVESCVSVLCPVETMLRAFSMT